MIATVALLLLVALLGLGAFAVLAGAVIAIIAAPGDRPVELPPRAAGIALVLVGLLTFVQASMLVAERVA